MAEKKVSVIAELVDKFSKNAEKLNKTTKGITKGFKSLKGILAGAAAGYGVYKFFEKTIENAEQEQDAVAQLSSALQQMGYNTTAALTPLQSLANSMELTTTYGNDEIETLEALFIRFGVAPDKMRGVIKATLDYARVTGKDVKRAAMDIGRALQGNVTMLQRYGINIDKAAVKTKGAAVVIDALEEKMGGAESAYADTFAGKIKQINNLYGDFLKQIGLAIVKNKGMQKALKSIKDMLVKLSGKASDANSSLGTFIGTLGDFISSVAEGAPAVIDAIATVGTFFIKILKTDGVILGDFAGAVAQLFGNIYDTFKTLINHIKHLDFKGAVKDLFKDAIRNVEDFVGKNSVFNKMLKEDIQKIWGTKKATDQMTKSTKKATKATKSAAGATKKASKNADDLAKSLGDADEVIKKFSANKLKDMHLKPFKPNLDFLDQYKVKVSQMQQYIVDRATKALEELRSRIYRDTMDFVDRALGGIGQVSDAFVAMMNGQEVRWHDVLNNMLKSLEHFVTEALIKFAILEGINVLTGGTAPIYGMLKKAFGFQAYGEGGFVSSPTLALVGEKEPEYIIPQSKMNFQVHVYNATPDTYVQVFSNLPLGAKMKIKEALA